MNLNLSKLRTNMIGNIKLAKQAGWIAIVGGVFQLLYGLLSIPFPYSEEINYGWSEALWTVACIGMIGAIFGLLIIEAGGPGKVAQLSGMIAILGLLIRIIAAIIIIVGSTWYPLPLILLGILLMLVGMFVLAIAILREKKLKGWQTWAPILVPIFGLITASIYSINLTIHFIMLGIWGLFSMLVGYVVILYASGYQE